MTDFSEQEKRIESIIYCDKNSSRENCINLFFYYIQKNLVTPCKVTGIEDFKWEEYYIIGPGNHEEFINLSKVQPSSRNFYEILRILKGEDIFSEWKLYSEDLVALVRRKTDAKEFYLGLSELKVVDDESSFQLLDDYSCWFVNSR